MAGLPCFLLLFLFLPLDPSSSSLEAPLGLSDDEPQPGKNTPESTTENSPVTGIITLEDSQMETTTNQLQLSEPEVLSTQEDNSQSIDEELEMPEKEIENILETLKEENSNPNDNLESSLMDSILQELKKHSEESVSTEENFTMTTESSSSESFTKEFSVEPELSQSPKPTPLPNLRVNEVNEDIKDAKRFEFFEKYEGIQDKKRAKTEDLKDLMKHIIIACVAVIGLILTVIVLVHIYNSLFVKKQQDPGVTNATVYKEDGTDKTEITEVEEKENQLLEYDNENLNNNSRLRSSPVISPAISCEDAIKPSRSS
ncbi:uncharacterized protein LOC121925492 isoform X8 [Sceloporus undulatus]|uniref:uncharacterized protein LOC121925492 isoform X8 n=1 Tax=Sceloporus undulatus TaxID=8520 RepID=UPI001C4BAA38|nr:uncharacterized protein LOC121925492 isoform X8 [Sceloporus undulatus]